MRHAGQVSLPGGVIEGRSRPNTPRFAKRAREIACATDNLRLLGRLTPIDIPVSGFQLHPVVATVDTRPTLAAADGEVARIIELRVATLLNPAVLNRRPMQRGALVLDVPVFDTHDVVIWGATAMVLAEFLTLLGWSPDRSRRS
ncbi:MAG: hypothetical protein QM736_01495 [Vicinamibacterales bacterium]